MKRIKWMIDSMPPYGVRVMRMVVEENRWEHLSNVTQTDIRYSAPVERRTTPWLSSDWRLR